MNIIKFLNSRDIAEYLQKIDYKFSPEEAMFVIHEGRNTPLKEKHAAYEELIRIYPDYPLKERREGVFKDHTLASFLRAYMEKENRLIEACKKNGDDAIYFAAQFSKADNCWFHINLYDVGYHSFQECFEETLKNDKDGDIVKLTVHKKYIPTNCMIELELLPDGTVLKVAGGITPERDEEIANAFEWMWIKIPTPFKKGDILVPRRERVWDYRSHEDDEDAFVLTDLCTWGSKELAENGYQNCDSPNYNRNERRFEAYEKLIEKYKEYGDISDMGGFGYFVGEQDTLYQDHSISEIYLDYEIFRGELKGKNRILTAVSNYLRGKIDLELLIKAYHAILLEEQLKGLKRFYLDYLPEEALIFAGLKKNETHK